MVHLISSICCASFIFLVFKGFEKFGIHTPYGIIINYLTAAVVGYSFYSGTTDLSELEIQKWILPAVLLGMLFIVVFNFIALTSQKMGLSTASVATKMSLIIPVILAVILHGERVDTVKITGVALALAAVFLASHKESQSLENRRIIYLPAIVFLGSGIIDASLKYMQETRVSESEFPLFSAVIFASAGLFGILFSIFRKNLDFIKPRPKDIIGGITLGVPNFFAVYFLLQALQFRGLNSVAIFTINNVSVVLITTLFGIFLFKERLSSKNKIGILFAALSIIFVGFF
jgi:drug/metabolite transporter (DMT)-like permease